MVARGFVRSGLGLALLLTIGCAPAASGSWYVDHASGHDDADGRSPQTAWKHAPGDNKATGRAASQRLQPGDKVIFRAGIPYRGGITLRDSGTADRPITYTGLGWGEGLAIIDGADPVRAVRPCASASDCGGARNWQQLSRVEFAPTGTSDVVLYGRSGPYWPSQLPLLSDPFFGNERRQFVVTELSQLPELKQGRLHSKLLADAARNGGRMELAIWIRSNRVVRRPVLRVEGDIVHFDAEGVRFYEDRKGAVALNGSFDGLQQPGYHVVVGPGLVVARLRPEDDADTLAIGSPRIGFNLNDQSHIVLTGFHFRHQTSSAGRLREGYAVTSFKRNARDIELSGSLFGPAVMGNRRGIVQLSGGDGFRFLANRIENIVAGGGFRATTGKPRNVEVKGNVIRKIGATGITMFGVTNGRIIGNILIDIQGIHGNAITAYLGNQNILIEGNCVVRSRRPLTYHGDRKQDMHNNLVIRRNIFIASPDGQAAINSWGKNIRGVRIEENLAVGPRLGMLINRNDRDVVIRGNDGGRIATRGVERSDQTIADNRTDLKLQDMSAGRFSEAGCHVPGTRIAPVTRWQAGN